MRKFGNSPSPSWRSSSFIFTVRRTGARFQKLSISNWISSISFWIIPPSFRFELELPSFGFLHFQPSSWSCLGFSSSSCTRALRRSVPWRGGSNLGLNQRNTWRNWEILTSFDFGIEEHGAVAVLGPESLDPPGLWHLIHSLDPFLCSQAHRLPHPGSHLHVLQGGQPHDHSGIPHNSTDNESIVHLQRQLLHDLNWATVGDLYRKYG